MAGRPRKYETVQDMESLIIEYFTEENKPWTVTGLALHLDLTTEGLREYSNREEYSATIKKAKLAIEDHLNKIALKGGYNATIAIFNLKNNFGWVDKQEIESKNLNLNQDITNLSDEELEKKRKELAKKILEGEK